jgi:hypothetical protein
MGQRRESPQVSTYRLSTDRLYTIHFGTTHLEHLECSLQPSPPGCFTKKLRGAR